MKVDFGEASLREALRQNEVRYRRFSAIIGKNVQRAADGPAIIRRNGLWGGPLARDARPHMANLTRMPRWAVESSPRRS